MLHALRTSLLALAIRRGIATLLALCVCVAFAEPALADSCDDGAKTQASSVSASLTADSSPSLLSNVNGRAESPLANTNGADHSIHVCHCAHAHIAPLARRQAIASAAPLLAFVRNVRTDLVPPSVVQEPQLRPPRMSSLA